MKGGAFEREVARGLSDWFSQGKRDDLFYRSHASGARFTQRRKVGKDTAYQSGDITCSDPEGKSLLDCFSIECKSGYGTKTKSGIARWDVLDLIDSKQKETVLLKMWKQCNGDAFNASKTPLLIFRRNQRTPCIAFLQSLLSKFIDFYGSPLFIYDTIRMNSLIIMNLKDFFEWIVDIRSFLTDKGLETITSTLQLVSKKEEEQMADKKPAKKAAKKVTPKKAAKKAPKKS